MAQQGGGGGGGVKMASQAAEQVEEEAADLQFPKGNCVITKISKCYKNPYVLYVADLVTCAC